MKWLVNEFWQGLPDWHGPWKEVILDFLRDDEQTGRSGAARRIYFRWSRSIDESLNLEGIEGERLLDDPLQGLDVELAEELITKIRGNSELWWTNQRVEEIRLLSEGEKNELLRIINLNVAKKI